MYGIVPCPQYRCKCRDAHWHALGGAWVAGGALRGEGATLACTPCGVGSDAAVCLADVYRAALLAANLAGMLICLIIGLIIFKKRKCKVTFLTTCYIAFQGCQLLEGRLPPIFWTRAL